MESDQPTKLRFPNVGETNGGGENPIDAKRRQVPSVFHLESSQSLSERLAAAGYGTVPMLSTARGQSALLFRFIPCNLRMHLISVLTT